MSYPSSQPSTPLSGAFPMSIPFYNSTPPPPPPKPTTRAEHPISPQAGPQPPPLPAQSSYGTLNGHTHQATFESDLKHAWQDQDAGAPVRGQPNPGNQQLDIPESGWLPPSLLDKSKADLEALYYDPVLMKALIQSPSSTHQSLTTSSAILESNLMANTSLAHHIKSLQSQLEQTRSHVSTHLLSVRALESRWRNSQSQLEARLEPWGPRELHQRLVASITEQGNLCIGVEESFIENDTGALGTEREIGDWVKRVREGRRLLHLRQERRGRWDEGRVGGWR